MRIGCDSSIDLTCSARMRVAIAMVMLANCDAVGIAAPSDSFLDIPMSDEFRSQWGGEFQNLCRMLDRSCGEEDAFCGQSKLDSNAPDLRLNKKSRPREVLDAIVRRHHSHRWVMRDDVINLEPKNGPSKDLLARQLDTVSIANSSSFKAALDVLEQANIKVFLFMRGRPARFRLISLTLKKVTVREALNAIAKADGHVRWSFCPSDPDKGEASFSMSSWRKEGVRPYDKKGLH